CWPVFDSSFVFGGLLDQEKGGYFQITPQGSFESSQYYIENTNVLVTQITSGEGTYQVTDFAPRFRQYDRYFKPLMLIRKIEPIEGTPRVSVSCSPRYEYGQRILQPQRGSSHILYR